MRWTDKTEKLGFVYNYLQSNSGKARPDDIHIVEVFEEKRNRQFILPRLPTKAVWRTSPKTKRTASMVALSDSALDSKSFINFTSIQQAFHQKIERPTVGSSVLVESTVLKSLLLTAASASLTTLSNIFLSRDLPWYWNSSTGRSLQEPSVLYAHRCASMISRQPALSGRG